MSRSGNPAVAGDALRLVPLEEVVATGGWRSRLRAFSCGGRPWEAELNDYLGHGAAVRDARQHLALTHLVSDADVIAGYVES